jgi:hypothetical protein
MPAPHGKPAKTAETIVPPPGPLSPCTQLPPFPQKRMTLAALCTVSFWTVVTLETGTVNETVKEEVEFVIMLSPLTEEEITKTPLLSKTTISVELTPRSANGLLLEES